MAFIELYNNARGARLQRRIVQLFLDRNVRPNLEPSLAYFTFHEIDRRGTTDKIKVSIEEFVEKMMSHPRPCQAATVVDVRHGRNPQSFVVTLETRDPRLIRLFNGT